MTEQLRFRGCRQNVGAIEQRKKSGFTLNSHHERAWTQGFSAHASFADERTLLQRLLFSRVDDLVEKQ